MRRTYRSKKDAGGALDHRDMILNVDEKSSIFNAFYIQNIKQTKRELSCVGSSNTHGVASKKVRKRKYVKRIVKEVERMPPRESMSSSTYLTPDKSIRVNKVLDPFDLLLSTSSTSQGVASPFKNNVNYIPMAKKESKTYTKKKLRNVKKFNYSSDDSSDKENTSNPESNTTDIRTHELLIEKECNNKPKNLDESINKIFRNQSLINNFKRKNSSFNTSYKNNRWTNCQSPILQRSPLCSTPFIEKYRGNSIYNFSPISTKERESANHVTIMEENNESNNSIVFSCKEKVPKLSKKHSSPQTFVPEKDKVENEVSMIYENEIDPQLDDSETEIFEPKEESSTGKKEVESASTEQSLFQITEAEPFLGFSNKESLANDRKYLLKCIQEPSLDNEEMDMSEHYNNDKENIDRTETGCKWKEKLLHFSVRGVNKSDNKSKIDADISVEIPSEEDVDLMEDENDNSDIEKSLENLSGSYKSNSTENQEVIIIPKQTTITDSSSTDSDKESMYDTCESEQSFSEEETDLTDLASPVVAVERVSDSVSLKHYNKGNKEPKVAIERLNDSVMIKYHEKRQKEPIVAIERLNDSVIIKYHEKSKKEPIVAIERLNDSVFSKYYDKMLMDNNTSNDMSRTNDTDENQSEVETSQTQADITSEYDSHSEATSDTTSEYDSHSEATSDTTSEYNESQNDLDTIQTEIYESVTENLNEEESLSNANEVNKSYDNDVSLSNSENNLSGTSKTTESDTVETQPSEIIITDSSAAEDIESDDEINNEDEKHVSFVTTRRRNEITNDSMFIFDNSYGSTSTECDKTVLSYKDRLSCFVKSELDLNVSVNNARTSGGNYFELCENEFQQNDNIGGTQRNTRNSLKPNRHSEVKSTDMDVKTADNKMVTIASPNQTIELTRSSVTTRKSSRPSSAWDRFSSISTEVKPSIVLQPGKKWERSLSIFRRMTMMADPYNQSLIEDDSQNKGRKYRQSVLNTMEMQDSLHNESINSRRSTFISKPSRPTIRFVKDSNNSTINLNTTEVFDDLKGFLTEECDDTVIELSKLSLADSEFEVTVLDNFHETSARLATARDYVLRRCNQTDTILFDECYPETVLKNCHKIGEGVYGEVFLWRGRDGRARVMKVVPIAGACKVNGEQQKDFHEVISEIVIAMELSALRAPIADIDRYFDEGKDVAALDLHSVENATDVFNEVLAVRCVQGPYPSRLLDLWELYDECKGSENDNPAALPADQQYIVLELANAGQDLESYQFTGAQQAHALFQQIAFGLAVGEESFQFEHRDLHWGNVLIAPTDQKLATFVLRGRTYRVPRGGVAATIIDYSLSRISLPLAAERAALYNDLSTDEQLFDAVGDYQFQIYRLMRDKLGNDWKNFEPYTNILWLHYTIDKMITALRYKRSTTKIHKHYIEKLKGIKEKILDYKSATEYVLTDIEI